MKQTSNKILPYTTEKFYKEPSNKQVQTGAITIKKGDKPTWTPGFCSFLPVYQNHKGVPEGAARGHQYPATSLASAVVGVGPLPSVLSFIWTSAGSGPGSCPLLFGLRLYGGSFRLRG